MNIEEARQSVSNNVSKAVDIAGSQVELARKSGITQGAIGKYLRKEAIPRASTARNISKAVDGAIPAHYFSPIEIPADI
jgi:transcriptional regulator with XRE-family HTH domain